MPPLDVVLKVLRVVEEYLRENDDTFPRLRDITLKEVNTAIEEVETRAKIDALIAPIMVSPFTEAVAAFSEQAEEPAKQVEKKGRSCYLHENCDAADAAFHQIEHCHDEDCEDCFGY